ncbi:MAG: phosphate ABC transporter permease subunit PstC [Deltaproteobacteria bacterium]|nr:phosphate ABC transporter permease subunit PstC [Deltaproteobacteria bacterium]
MQRRKLAESIIYCLLFLCGSLSIFVTTGIVIALGIEALGFFEHVSLWEFLFDTEWTPLFSIKRFGIAPLVAGTLLTSAIALIIALPLGLLVAVYLGEFASEPLRRVLRPILELLAGIPTIVYGYFALLFVTPLLQTLFPELPGFNALSPGLVMGFMILPMVASLSEDALYSVPQGLKEAAYAMGCTRLQMVFKVLIPSALGGITAAFILAMSRAVGETMIVAIAAGQQPNLTLDPTSPVETMTAYIVQISLGDTPHGTLEYRTIFAVGLMLFLITLLLNSVSFMIRNRYRNA